MEYAAVVVLAAVVSFDGLAAGMAYGVRGIRLPAICIALVSITSALSMLISMTIGGLLRTYTSPIFAQLLGAGLLIALGFYLLLQRDKPMTPPGNNLLYLRIKPFGLVIQVLRDPLAADSDNSGTIGGFEAFVLGLALALDAFCVGLGAALTGLPPLLTAATIGGCKFCFVSAGISIGHRLTNVMPKRYSSLLPGVMLILVGIWRLM